MSNAPERPNLESRLAELEHDHRDHCEYAFELDRFHRHGGRVRKELFPSYCNDRGWTLPGVVKDSPAPPVASVAEKHFDMPTNPVLARIAELLGAKRFDLWFGDDTDFHDDDKPFFEVRNNFRLNSIRRNCKTETEQALFEFYGKEVHYDFKVREPPAPVPERKEVMLMKMK